MVLSPKSLIFHQITSKFYRIFAFESFTWMPCVITVNMQMTSEVPKVSISFLQDPLCTYAK